MDDLEVTSIRALGVGEAATCEQVMRSLPDWFGIEQSIVEYRDALEKMETIVAARNREIVGFLALRQHNSQSAEIHVMAVLEPCHRLGVGRSLVTHAEALVRARGTAFLQVKTLGPSRESDAYAGTRKFYQAMGFVPLEETNLWGDANPCLILVKHVSCTLGHSAS